LPTKFPLTEVESILVSKFLAKEINKENFLSLKRDSFANYDHIYKCYEINNPSALQSIFNDEEVIMINELIEYNQSISNGIEKSDEEKMWIDIQEGRLLRIVVESIDLHYISSFTLQGVCEKVLDELVVLSGIDSKEVNLDNKRYLGYLSLLKKTGYI
jgi:hypothetical protein